MPCLSRPPCKEVRTHKAPLYAFFSNLLPLRSKYSPQHPAYENPQLLLLTEDRSAQTLDYVLLLI